jgi:hypothetical protein
LIGNFCQIKKETKKDLWVAFGFKKDAVKAKVTAVVLKMESEARQVNEIIITCKTGEAITFSILDPEQNINMNDSEFSL